VIGRRTDQGETRALAVIPELESVEYSTVILKLLSMVAWVICSLICAAIAAAIAAAVVRLLGRPDLTLQVFAVCGVAGLVALGYAMGARSSWFDFAVATSPEGVYSRGFIHKEFVRWSDVVSVDIKPAQFTLRKTRGSISHSVLPGGSGPQFLSSVHYHALRNGKKVTGSPSDIAWHARLTVPAWVPIEMDWHNRSPKSWKLAAFWAVLVVVAVGAYAFFSLRKGHEFDFGIGQHIFTALMAAVLLTASRLNTAGYLQVRSDRLEARTTLRRITTLWSQVTTAVFDKHGLVLKSTQGAVVVPFAAREDDATTVILCIVRHLWNRVPPLAVALPAPLFELVAGGSVGTERNETLGYNPEVVGHAVTMTGDDRAVVRAPLLVRICATGFLFLLAAVWWIADIRHFGGWVAWSFYALCALVFLHVLATGVDSIIADDEGVCRRRLFLIRRFRWSEVASYSRKVERTVIGIEMTTHVLRNAAGEVLIRVREDSGSSTQMARFARILGRKLAGVPRVWE